MISKIHNKLKEVSGYFQSSIGSFKRHNAQYEELGKLEKERTIGLQYIANNEINSAELRILDLLALHPDIQQAIDIGSGTGWGSASLAKHLDSIIALEPSLAAIAMAKTLYPSDSYKNIQWRHGFAETELLKLTLTAPALFFTSCVLSHIRDKEVIKICQAIDTVAPAGSVFSLAECWGEKPWHQLMWHVRTKDWWQAQFPGWELDFHGPLVPESTLETGPYHKGIWGVKK
jgi:trans-aconitate methyltransferase